MDIVLAPLADHPFMRCKSNIRCMTAGLVGAPVVASPVGPYATYVKDGRNGFLARSPAEWTAALERLVSDPALRQRMGAANRQCARGYAISANLHHWTHLYAGLLGRHRRA
jgi:glycosyltransferase involved in cell wall biosynthesis